MPVLGTKGAMSAFGYGWSRSGLLYVAQRSLIYTAASSQDITRTLVAPTDADKWTFNTFLKRTTAGVWHAIFSAEEATIPAFQFGSGNWGDALNTLNLMKGAGGSPFVGTNETITDTTTWHNLHVVYDAGQGSPAARVLISLDAVACTYAVTDYPAQFAPFGNINANGGIHHIGSRAGGQFGNFLLCHTRFVDGQALPVTDFTTGSGAGTTHPKRYTGTFGANGAFISYANPASTATLGYDDGTGVQGSHAGTNDWALVNMTTGNSSTDVPT